MDKYSVSADSHINYNLVLVSASNFKVAMDVTMVGSLNFAVWICLSEGSNSISDTIRTVRPRESDLSAVIWFHKV